MGSTDLSVRSFAKVNLALSILGKRPDGYHEIRTVLQTIDLYDEIEFRASSQLRLRCEDLPTLPIRDNLVWKAATALSQATSVTRGAEIILRKRIPVGSGLGGGSSNAAATLLGLCRLWDIRMDGDDLRTIAASLGSDIPFFLQGGTALAIGRGEEVYPLADLSSASIVVIFPGIQVSTAQAYSSQRIVLTSRCVANKISSFCGQLLSDPSCLALIFNDFETSILPAYPAIREAKGFLIQRRSISALLSGSGSSVFGFFSDEESALAASRAVPRESWRAFPAKTLSRAEYFQRMFG